MTENSKQNLLDYLIGNIKEEPKNDGIDFSHRKIIINNVYEQLTALGYSNFVPSGFLTSDKSDNIAWYGNNIDTHEEESETIQEYQGIIIIFNKDFEIIKILDSFDSGTKFGKFEMLAVDETGNFYGVDNQNSKDNRYRFIMLDNFLISITGDYSVKLRTSYYFPEEYNRMKIQSLKTANGLLKKIPNESIYSLIGSLDDKLTLLTLKINVGMENEWKIYNSSERYTTLEPVDYVIDLKDDILQCDGRIIEISSKKLKKIEIEADSLTVVPIMELENKNMYYTDVIMLNGGICYIAGSESSENTNLYFNVVYKCDVDGLKKILYEPYTTQYVGSSIHFLYSQGIVFVIISEMNSITTSLFEIGMIVDDKIYSTILYDGVIINYDYYNCIYFKKEFNLYKLFFQAKNEALLVPIVYDSTGYNGGPYVNEESLNSNSAVLYDYDYIPVFARNLYNKTINESSTVSTIEIPNSYVNNINIYTKQLFSKSNVILVENYDVINKNIYESVYLNFINDISIVDKNKEPYIENKKASIRLNKSINTSDYKNAKMTKYRINYDDGTTELRNLFAKTTNTVSGTKPRIEDSRNSAAKSFIVYGKSEQETKDGKNLFRTFPDGSITNLETAITSIATVQQLINYGKTLTFEKGEITGYPNEGNGTYYIWKIAFSKLKPDTEYTCACECVCNNLTGNEGNLLIFNKAFHIQNGNTEFKNKIEISFTTDSDGSYNINNFINFANSLYAENTFMRIYNIQLLEGKYTSETIPDYEPYNKMPSPELPSEIKCVGRIINFFKTNDITQEILHNGTYEITGNNSFILDLTSATSYGWSGLVFKIENLKKNTDYTLKCNTYKNQSDNAQIYTVIQTLPASESGNIKQSYGIDGNGVQFNSGNYETLYAKIVVNANATNNVYYFSKIQLCEQSVKSYIPYGHYLKLVNQEKNLFNINRNLGTPNNSTFANTTKRLFNYDTYINGIAANNYYDPSHIKKSQIENDKLIVETDSSAYCVGFPFLLKSGESYTVYCNISKETINAIRVSFYNEEGTIFDIPKFSIGTSNILDFNVPDGYPVCMIAFSTTANVETEFSNIQLLEGKYTSETIPDYESYRKNEVLVDLQNYELCSIENVRDELDIISGKGIKRIKEYIFTGEESGITIDSNGIFFIHINDLYNPLLVRQKVVISNKFKAELSTTSYYTWTHDDWQNVIAVRYISDTSCSLGIKTNIANNLDEFKSWLKDQYNNGTPLKIKYILQTPQEFTIEPVQFILYEGTNDIVLEDEIETELEIQYYYQGIMAFLICAIYVDKKIKNIEFISNDEQTVYQTIDLSHLELNKYYKISQRLEVI